MKKELVGVYQLGSENVRLIMAHDKNGGRFWACPDHEKAATIEVSAGQDNWWQVVAVLMHEANELAYYRAGLRFSKTPDYANDNGSYLFVMDHTDFSEANARAAHFLTKALPNLATAWNRWKRVKPCKKPPKRRKR